MSQRISSLAAIRLCSSQSALAPRGTGREPDPKQVPGYSRRGHRQEPRRQRDVREIRHAARRASLDRARCQRESPGRLGRRQGQCRLAIRAQGNRHYVAVLRKSCPKIADDEIGALTKQLKAIAGKKLEELKKAREEKHKQDKQ